MFVPGWCCDTSFFQPQFDHFAVSHEVVALDLRGCGQSDRPDGGYDIPTQTDDVAWLIGELALERSTTGTAARPSHAARFRSSS